MCGKDKTTELITSLQSWTNPTNVELVFSTTTRQGMVIIPAGAILAAKDMDDTELVGQKNLSLLFPSVSLPLSSLSIITYLLDGIPRLSHWPCHIAHCTTVQCGHSNKKSRIARKTLGDTTSLSIYLRYVPWSTLFYHSMTTVPDNGHIQYHLFSGTL